MHSSELGKQPYPLHNAAREGKVDVLVSLLKTKAYDINYGNSDLIRPLHEACLHGHFDCVQALLDFDAQVDIRNIDGATPLCDACANGSVEIVHLLLRYGAHVNPPLLLTSPLHESVLRNNKECVQLLLDHGANPNISDCHFGMPLHIAAARGHLECARSLLHSGANVNAVRIHATALHDAARHNDAEMLLLLLEHGANVYARDNQGRTARDLLPTESDEMSSAKKLLVAWESNPKSLLHFCRLRIFYSLGSGRHLFLEQFSLPKSLKNFLLFLPEMISQSIWKCIPTEAPKIQESAIEEHLREWTFTRITL